MEELTGNIFINEALDYESNKEYVFSILATDGDRIGEADLIINVVNLNDNLPIFEKEVQQVEVNNFMQFLSLCNW